MKVIAMLSLFVLLLPSTFVQAQTSAVIGVSTVYTEKTGNVELVVFVESDERIAAGSFEVDYDPALLTVRATTIVEGEALTRQLSSTYGAEAGKIGFSWAQATGVKMTGTLLTFTGNVTRDGVGELIELKLKNVHLYAESGIEISPQLLHGHVKPFTGTTTEATAAVDVDKTWVITLNKSYNPATVNEQTVRVLNRTGKLVEVVIERDGGNTIIVTPKTQYAKGNHTLEISDQIRSASGGKLNEPRRHEFTVK